MLDKTMILLAACAAFGILSILLTVLYLRSQMRRNDLQEQLEHQLERVETRREKILQLRSVITLLIQECKKRQDALEGRPSAEEMQEYYSRITDAMLRIYKRMDLSEGKKAKINNSEFCMLTEQISLAFSVENDHSMPWYAKAEGEEIQAEVKPIYTVQRALIVDDNHGIAASFSRMLEMNGYRTEIASSGEQAIEMFIQSKEGYYSFIFMDMVLDGMNGCDAAREIRRTMRYDSERVPIIAVTANDFAEDMLRMQEAGMNDRILKPIEEEAVKGILYKWKDSAEVLADHVNAATEAEETEKVDDTWASLSSAKPVGDCDTDTLRTSG